MIESTKKTKIFKNISHQILLMTVDFAIAGSVFFILFIWKIIKLNFDISDNILLIHSYIITSIIFIVILLINKSFFRKNTYDKDAPTSGSVIFLSIFSTIFLNKTIILSSFSQKNIHWLFFIILIILPIVLAFLLWGFLLEIEQEKQVIEKKPTIQRYFSAFLLIPFIGLAQNASETFVKNDISGYIGKFGKLTITEILIAGIFYTFITFIATFATRYIIKIFLNLKLNLFYYWFSLYIIILIQFY